jgi:NitT/TauT family transport system ATP-binding protein
MPWTLHSDIARGRSDSSVLRPTGSHVDPVGVNAYRPGEGIGTDAALRAENVGFTYSDGTVAVGSVSLEIERGRSVGIVGPSGCGKSTLLSLIAGLYRPTSGVLEVTSGSSQRRPIGMVFQKDTLLPWLTVRKNVALYYSFHGGRRRRRAADAEVNELIKLVGLQGFEDSYPYQLSGGMRRRVAFLAGVAARPEMLLLDEPFSSLDEPTRLAIHQDVFSIIREFNMTMILVTHDLAEAVSLCDEVLIFSARPSSVVSSHPMPFGAERNMLTLRQTPEFLSSYGTLWQELSLEIEKSRALSSGPDGGSGQ